MQPYKLDLSQFGEKLRDKIDFKISNVSDQKLDLSMIAFPDKYFEVQMPKSIEPGKSVDCTLKLKKDVIEENFEKSFTIETSDEGHSRFTVPVRRQVRGTTTPTASTAGH